MDSGAEGDILIVGSLNAVRSPSMFTSLRGFGIRILVFGLLCLPAAAVVSASTPARTLTLERSGRWVIVHGPHIPGGQFRLNYLEAYCRAGSTNADWKATTIPFQSEVVSLSENRKTLRIRDRLSDGLVVEHTVTAKDDEVEFRLQATNPTAQRSGAHWAQACHWRR